MLDQSELSVGNVGPISKAFREWLNGGSTTVLRRAQLADGLGQTFPGGSRQRVSNAGARIREGIATNEDVAVIDTWREAHRHVINSFQAVFRNRTRDTAIVVAQRHKRKRTIVDKLNRYPTMRLSRMDDVAGCRLIFDTIDNLYAFRESFHGARFNHKLKNAPDKYDDISHPKFSGYRGIHDVYEYDSTSACWPRLQGSPVRSPISHTLAACMGHMR